jgi:hypothetical protein
MSDEAEDVAASRTNAPPNRTNPINHRLKGTVEAFPVWSTKRPKYLPAIPCSDYMPRARRPNKINFYQWLKWKKWRLVTDFASPHHAEASQ